MIVIFISEFYFVEVVIKVEVGLLVIVFIIESIIY